MRTIRLWVLFAFLALNTARAQQQSSSPVPVLQTFTLAQLRSDFDQLYQALNQAHPGLRVFQSTSVFAQRYDSLRANLKENETELDFLRAVSTLVSGIGCGHSSCFPSQHYTEKQEEAYALFFPFKVNILNRHIYLTGNFSSDTTILTGSELLELNGKKATDILDQLLNYIPGDGYTQCLKYHILEEDFMILYSEYIGQPQHFTLKLKLAGEDREQIRNLPPLKKEALKKNAASRTSINPYSRPAIPSLAFELTSDKIGMLTIRSFDKEDIRKGGQHFKSFIRRAFKTLNEQGANDLVIDLRNNEGGDDDFGWYLYSFLTDSSFHYYSQIIVATDKKFSFLSFCSKSFVCRMLHTLVHRDKDGIVRWKHGRDTRILRPQQSPFRGKVFVLINGGSFSTTAEFSAISQYHNKALFIGEESGGDYSGDNSGLITLLTLPNTHVRVKLPLFRFELAVDPNHPKGHGIIPDQVIPRNINDILKGVDTQKEYIVEYIRKKNCKGCGR